jgi:alkylated DNA repair dioxygenase AlkB
MQSLFPPEYPQGFSYEADFISPAEEEQLISFIRATPLHTFIFHGFEAKRKVASFGYDYSFEKKDLSAGAAIPDELLFVAQRVAKHLNIPVSEIAEALLTEYPVGAVINWHRDAPPFGIIAGISLGAACKMKLKPHDKNKQTRQAIKNIPLERRSLYIMQGEAREEWQHAIGALREVRYSITLRTLRKAAAKNN